ncbi:retinaldehyde-binding protein 1 [Anthonomus grandis grandis]|uniref:retinaldehyde-binding protein 1 n=1 Tax=Anthonomus grandis grandis TaxID=2921223 RepID=UPI0021656E02|nr:retinaldehyde-binding protein 1 [Anthonomus grandis grandis]XP_050294750.1 retinaldehyde-binding protein 1 [Anthonomus grandis grandis]
MSTQLIISTPQWSKSHSDIAEYEKDMRKQQQTILKKELQKISEKELRETDNSRKECLRQLKAWIEKNEDIRNCIMDDSFLLRFLRVKKFSIPMAQQTLLKYLNYRKRFPHIFFELDYSVSKVNDLISNGYIFVSPLRDTKGRRVIIYDLNKFDAKIYTGTDMARAHAITYETLLADEENQILGVTHVADIGGVNASFLTLFSVTDFGYLIKWGEQSFPMRHKEIHILNMPHALKYVYDFAKSNMSQKLKERIMVHNSTLSLFQKVDKRCFPKEMGGEIPSKDMISSWQHELDDKRKRLLAIDDIELLSDRGIICSRNSSKYNDNAKLVGSFRKLEVD